MSPRPLMEPNRLPPDDGASDSEGLKRLPMVHLSSESAALDWPSGVEKPDVRRRKDGPSASAGGRRDEGREDLHPELPSAAESPPSPPPPMPSYLRRLPPSRLSPKPPRSGSGPSRRQLPENLSSSKPPPPPKPLPPFAVEMSIRDGRKIIRKLTWLRDIDTDLTVREALEGDIRNAPMRSNHRIYLPRLAESSFQALELKELHISKAFGLALGIFYDLHGLRLLVRST